ncbi:hypothetical protein E5206_18535 [Arthrobacter sp. PAMC25564]|uniref:hypothetical protein n=1 Tax=Arthrobacter sp. PAMC25564 TaxID=2565366 RepID=UPI0010A20676|nr:hypothetical protein [Arthrobacter sp. PAMC25564]QCB98657.1 hypothetical protein E5206_18535 [Arthrobacter sp. PAMC25564]
MANQVFVQAANSRDMDQANGTVAAIVDVVVSLLTRPTDPSVMKNWYRRVAGCAVEEEQIPVLAHQA